ncbi:MULTISPECIES: NAD(P)/FAD-dependent oxidoreductase, partial [unclassified Ensifer]
MAEHTTEKLVIVGNGMAPGRMLEELFEKASGRYAVTIFNAEPRVNYDRIMLSPVLSGEKDYEQIIIHGDGWYIKHDITLYKGHKIIAIDRDAKTVTSDHGVTESYDKLVIATGSVPFIIPVPGKDLRGVITYRDLDDVQAMLLAAQSREKAVVIGGGLLGLEAAAGLNARGMDVTVLHVMPTLMERQLDPSAGYLLQRAVEERGIKVITKANTKRIVGEEKVEGIELDDGRIIPATLVVMAVGIRPNVGLAKEAGLATNRGIVVDAGMQTSDGHIMALGECAEVGGMVYGLVAPLYEMARVAARHLAGDRSAAFVHADTPTKLKVTGINLYSVGDFADGDGREEIVLRDATAGIYKRLVLKENRIIGTVLYGETGDGAWFNDLMKRGTDITEMRDTLIFGQAYQGGSPLDPMAAVAALPDDAEICGCNGVCKGKIVSTIGAKSLTSLDDVRAHTKASASCGSCTGLVEQLMSLTLGDSYNPAAVQPMCACTELGHDDVRRLIKAKGLKTIPAVMQEL